MDKKKLSIILMVVFITSLFTYISYDKKEAFNHDAVAGGNHLIRFHVLANSDAPKDQQLKNKVRDAVIPYMSDLLITATSIHESRGIIEENLSIIEAIAKEELLNNGSSQPVRVVLENHLFPTRMYGNTVLIAGEYEALRIIIGEGTGRNWWCVMFPPLCFIDIKNGLIDEKTRGELQRVLTEEEFQTVFSEEGNNVLSLQLRSKIWDWFRASRNQILRFASKF